jgi:hypothetical protein
MSTPVITPAQARKELARRAARKGTAKRNNRPAHHIFAASGETLKALAATHGHATPTQAPAPKPAPVVNPHTALRKAAWELRLDARRNGEKLTYAQACELVGTTPARKAA